MNSIWCFAKIMMGMFFLTGFGQGAELPLEKQETPAAVFKALKEALAAKDRATVEKLVVGKAGQDFDGLATILNGVAFVDCKIEGDLALGIIGYPQFEDSHDDVGFIRKDGRWRMFVSAVREVSQGREEAEKRLRDWYLARKKALEKKGK